MRSPASGIQSASCHSYVEVPDDRPSPRRDFGAAGEGIGLFEQVPVARRHRELVHVALLGVGEVA